MRAMLGAVPSACKARSMVRSRRRGRIVCVLVALIGLCASSALAADLRVLCPAALREPVLDLARSYSRSSGQRIEFIFASVGAIHKRVAGGEHADVAIGTSEGVRALVKLGPGVEGSQAVIARSTLALAVRPGSLRINVASRESVAAALASAHTLAAPDPRAGVPGGAQVAELLDLLGLAEPLGPKMRWVLDPREALKRVAAGEVDLALAAMNDVVGSGANVAVFGPITVPSIRGIDYAAVVTRSASSPDQARAFIAHLRTAEAERAFLRAGYLVSK